MITLSTLYTDKKDLKEFLQIKNFNFELVVF